MPQLNNQLLLNRCPHCNVHKPNLPIKWATNTRNHSGENIRYWHIYQCATCGGLTTAWANSQNGNIIAYYPTTMTIHPAIPNPAATYLQQAIDSANAPASSVLVSASSVDAMLKIKGYTEGKLFERINQAVDANLITKEMARWAHEIRLDANNQRHADLNAALPTENDARKCIDFAMALAEFLFVLPERVERGLAEAEA